YYPAREGGGLRLAELLAQQDEKAADDPRSPVLRSTIFQRDDVVVRLVDVRGGETDAGHVLGLTDRARTAELTALLDADALGVDASALGDGAADRLLTLARMELVTDRRSPDA
ncbi:TcmI family type II polyketide cyclase, partial [Streptomyces sp. NPDC057052]